MLLPKEHGAYAQMAFPLVTALAVSGSSREGWLLVAVVCAGFVAQVTAYLSRQSTSGR
jgi:hypothetical protein